MKTSINAGLGILVALALASAHAGTGEAAAPTRVASKAIPRAEKPVPVLPQPGGGAMTLAGLLAAGAIARRRMSA